MKLGFELTLEQKQTLVMTPELIQAIQILQYNVQELDIYIEEQLLVNPILEVNPESPEDEIVGEYASDGPGAEPSEETFDRRKEKARDEDFDWNAYLEQREYDDISYRHMAPGSVIYDEDNGDEAGRLSDEAVSLSDDLIAQLGLAEISEPCEEIGLYVIASLDRNGYLTQDEDEIARHLGVKVEKVRKMVKLIQTFEPAGVGAHDLKECLLLQLEDSPWDCVEIRRIISEHLEDLAANRLGLIAKKLNLGCRRTQELADAIRGLEPKPGRKYGLEGGNRYIIPDVIIENIDGEFTVTINDNRVPRLMISPYYRQVLKDSGKGSKEGQFLTERLNSALWLMKSIEQRNQTIYNVVVSILRRQMDFFRWGEKHLKPLTLRKIADDVGVHESTVSRSISGKYVQTPRGVFEIKYFFTSGVSDGSLEGVASGSVKSLIKDIIRSEDPSSPLSDQAIAERLCDKGIDISRRTVAKYREDSGVPSSSRRRRY